MKYHIKEFPAVDKKVPLSTRINRYMREFDGDLQVVQIESIDIDLKIGGRETMVLVVFSQVELEIEDEKEQKPSGLEQAIIDDTQKPKPVISAPPKPPPAVTVVPVQKPVFDLDQITNKKPVMRDGK